jgi:5-methylcytosine-specific restriction endonuclease McrA
VTYSDMLKDPIWQRRRTDILNRDNFTCQKCGNDKDTLHVHHRHYINGRKPWDYPDTLLVTLYYKCHKEEENFVKDGSNIY